MFKFLIFIAVLYFGYKGLKSYVLKKIFSANPISGARRTEIDDIMVKDPFCEVYFPKREGVSLTVEGETFYFCCAECRDKFIASRQSRRDGRE